MKRLIFLDTNWILGNDYKNKFPSESLKTLLDKIDELDQLIILPTVFDELVAKVGFEKTHQLKNMNIKIIERIVGFPYEVFTRIKNRQPQFFKQFEKERQENASYLMSNDFLIMFEMTAIVHDQLGKFGICMTYFLTADKKFKEMLRKIDSRINFENKVIPQKNTKWTPSELKNYLNKYIERFIEQQRDFYKINNVHLAKDFEIKEVMKNGSLEEYLVTALIPFDPLYTKVSPPFGRSLGKLNEQFLITIFEKRPHLTPIKSGWNVQTYHLSDERRILALLKNFLKYIYKDEPDWWIKFYFMSLSTEELIALENDIDESWRG